MLATVVPVAAAVTIQAAWRAFSARKHIDPPVSTRLVRRRAALALQRWWKNILFKMRFRQLDTLRRQVWPAWAVCVTWVANSDNLSGPG